MVDDIVAAMDEIEADEGVGAIVVTGAPRVLRRRRPRQPRRHRRRARVPLDLRRLPADRALASADHRGRERRRRRRRHEHGARLRRPGRRHPGEVRHPLRPDRPAPGRGSHVDAATGRRPAGGRRGRAVRRGARRAGRRAGRTRLPVRRRRRPRGSRACPRREGRRRAARARHHREGDTRGDGDDRIARRSREPRADAAGVVARSNRGSASGSLRCRRRSPSADPQRQLRSTPSAARLAALPTLRPSSHNARGLPTHRRSRGTAARCLPRACRASRRHDGSPCSSG